MHRELFLNVSRVIAMNFTRFSMNRLLSGNSILYQAQRWQSVRIGCASGFWGDTNVSTPQLLYTDPGVNYIVYDYLSEITMSLLARMRADNPKLGFCPDFVSHHMLPYIQDIKKKGVKIVSNAGGLNPASCADALKSAAESKGVKNLKIAVITGDDLLQQKDHYLSTAFGTLDGGSVPTNATWTSLNVYFGAGPIAKALDMGADIVITGRCTDSSLALGPLMHEFKWKPDDWNHLALGSVAGHLIECGAQSTGGISTDWQETSATWSNIGFPIVEFSSDDLSSFTLTKPKGTGGNVSFATVAEQLVYEIGDPTNYILPDVVVDMSNVTIQNLTTGTKGSTSAVKVSNAIGKPALAHYKVSGTTLDGYRSTAVCPVIGFKAEEKAMATAKAILKRCSSIFKKLNMADFKSSYIHVLGTEQSYGAHAEIKTYPRECALWLAVEHENKNALQLFAREIAPAGTGMAPGLTTIIGGRPNVSPVLRLRNFLTKKDILAHISIDSDSATYRAPEADSNEISPASTPQVNMKNDQSQHSGEKLSKLACARSGDKGDTANIGIVCRQPEYYSILRKQLTESVVKEYFSHLLAPDSTVTRYELPGIYAFNFVLTKALGGGGVASLRPDPQGKAYAQMLLDWKLP